MKRKPLVLILALAAAVALTVGVGTALADGSDQLAQADRGAAVLTFDGTTADCVAALRGDGTFRAAMTLSRAEGSDWVPLCTWSDLTGTGRLDVRRAWGPVAPATDYRLTIAGTLTDDAGDHAIELHTDHRTDRTDGLVLPTAADPADRARLAEDVRSAAAALLGWDLSGLSPLAADAQDGAYRVDFLDEGADRLYTGAADPITGRIVSLLSSVPADAPRRSGGADDAERQALCDAAAGFLRTGLAAEDPGAGEVRLPRYASGETSQRSVFVFFPACAGYVELSWDGQPLGYELFSSPEDMAAFRDAASAALPR